jgi:hypothetical protein
VASNSNQQNAYNAAQSTGKGVIFDALGNPVIVGAQMPTGAGSGKVVASDASGNLTLQSVGAGPGALLAANNLSDVASASTALSNLSGLPLAGGTMAGPIAMGSNKITGLTNGSGAQDAAAFGQIPVIGGTSFTTVGFGLSTGGAAVTANQLYLTTVYIPVACTLTGLAIENGGTATGNVLAGIYNAAGSTQLAVSNSTAQSGTFHGQQIPFTSTLAVTPGTYIFALTYSSGSATSAASINVAPASSTAQGGFSLPSTVTPPASMLVTSIPMMVSY